MSTKTGQPHQRWRRLPPGTSEARAKATRDSWVEKSLTDPNFLAGAGEPPANQTLAQYATVYFARRKTRTNKVDERRISNHVLSVLGHRPIKEIRVAEIRSLVAGLVAGPKIHNKSIRNVYGVLATMFKYAVRDERDRCEGMDVPATWASPCTLAGEELPSIDVLSPRSRTPGPYKRDEVVALITDARILHDRRTFNALMLLTGMRHGEAAGLRWRVYDETVMPLGRIDLKTQYDGRPLKGKGEAGGKPRQIPVHPLLAFLLAEWKLSGFAKTFGRPPEPDDYIVPTRRKGKRPMNYRKPHASLESHQRDCEKIGIVPRRDHDMRHTFISLARGDGARVDMLEKVTHNAKGKMIDHYTHVDWEPICEAVSRLRLDIGASPTDGRAAKHVTNHAKDATPCEFVGNLAAKSATPMGIETVDRVKTPTGSVRLGPFRPHDATDRVASQCGLGPENDPIATKLRLALESAIAEGRPTEAAQLASELATRAAAMAAPNVLPFERGRTRDG